MEAAFKAQTRPCARTVNPDFAAVRLDVVFLCGSGKFAPIRPKTRLSIEFPPRLLVPQGQRLTGFSSPGEFFYMSTPYLLICVEKPKEEPDARNAARKLEWGRWFSFLAELDMLKVTIPSADKPAENIFLIPLDQIVSHGTVVLEVLRRLQIDHKVFYLESAPQPCS